jgi:hypothetical protein
MRSILWNILVSEGYDVVVARNGEDGLALRERSTLLEEDEERRCHEAYPGYILHRQLSR